MISEVLGLEKILAAWVDDNTRRLHSQLRRHLRRRNHIITSKYPPIVPHRFACDAMSLGTRLTPLDRLFGQELALMCRNTSAYGDVLSHAVVEKWKLQKISNPKNIVPT